ncbi:MAG: zf-TFIIB domain-containing protein, partial [Tepidisphaeraceae bacterium]
FNTIKPQELEGDWRYRPCPQCGQMMNRINFAGGSGIVLDICKPHGIWFDHDELRKIIEFIREGGLDRAREVEKQKLSEQRRQLDSDKRTKTPEGIYMASSHDADVVGAFSLVARALRDFF